MIHYKLHTTMHARDGYGIRARSQHFHTVKRFDLHLEAYKNPFSTSPNNRSIAFINNLTSKPSHKCIALAVLRTILHKRTLVR